MKVTPLYSNSYKNRQLSPNFRSKTVYESHKIIEKDILSLSEAKYLAVNPETPKQEILGVNLSRADEKTIELTSRYGNKTGTITYNPNVKQPEINVQAGSFQPVIELKDEELGITLLMTRGSTLQGNNLNVNYKPVARPDISFRSGHNLVVATGYKAEKTSEIVNNYNFNREYSTFDVFMQALRRQYTIFGLGAGYGSRLKPISDLTGDNKLSTKYPGGKNSIFEVAVLDAAMRLGKIGNIQVVRENPDNLSGTAGAIIKCLKNGTVPMDKPLILLTGDTFNNIDLSEAAYQAEQFHLSGIAMLVSAVDENELIGKAPIKFDENNEITELYPVITPENYSEIVSKAKVEGKIYTGTNIVIIQPEILSILKKFADADGKADFLEFFGLMFNTLNKNTEILEKKYPNGLTSEELKISDLVDYTGNPNPVYNKDNKALKLKAIVANKDYLSEYKCFSSDMGTIEEYFNTLHKIKKEKSIVRMKQETLDTIKSHIDDNGVIYMNTEAKSKLVQFQQKYDINSVSGNVIVHSFKPKQPVEITPAPAVNKKEEHTGGRNLLDLTYKPEENDITVGAMFLCGDVNNFAQQMIQKHGLLPFISWYLSPKGYYGAYERYVQKLYNRSNSLEMLLKYAPNWSPWKLEEKSWLLQNPSLSNVSENMRERLFHAELDKKREIPFTIGKLPEIFPNNDAFLQLIKTLKTREILDASLYIGGGNYKVERLKGGELNDKFIYLLERNNKKFILKFDRINVEDSDTVDGRKLSLIEQRSIRKNKYTAADSIYSNACISAYLQYNGCSHIPEMFYYHHGANAAIYEYIEDKDGDLFQHNLLNTEYDSLSETNKTYKMLNKLGVFLNDTAYKNTLTDSKGMKKIIDLGHASFFMPFKPGIKHYNIEFANTNGPDMSAIYAGLLNIQYSL
ncbi:MAG: hypothetical protein PHX18_06070 [Candidatus Gastranaerophilales bacterium]|nr:hypothetical protein [Candidatus Gastranaerophilales bacterium]